MELLLAEAKNFFRWLYNVKIRGRDDEVSSAADIGYNCNIDGETSSFIRIKQRRTKRLSPYSETEIWELHELQTIIKYASAPRDKAALSLSFIV